MTAGDQWRLITTIPQTTASAAIANMLRMRIDSTFMAPAPIPVDAGRPGKGSKHGLCHGAAPKGRNGRRSDGAAGET